MSTSAVPVATAPVVALFNGSRLTVELQLDNAALELFVKDVIAAEAKRQVAELLVAANS